MSQLSRQAFRLGAFNLLDTVPTYCLPQLTLNAFRYGSWQVDSLASGPGPHTAVGHEGNALVAEPEELGDAVARVPEEWVDTAAEDAPGQEDTALLELPKATEEIRAKELDEGASAALLEVSVAEEVGTKALGDCMLATLLELGLEEEEEAAKVLDDGTLVPLLELSLEEEEEEIAKALEDLRLAAVLELVLASMDKLLELEATASMPATRLSSPSIKLAGPCFSKQMPPAV
ncbi:hypothetical protein LTR37_004677 [Vermiconidia calcicola]|uniref:Uncharacterized protein n=1 Tax=Vermiconidia calcicola TaxID=1690605 RepID=A0ACC3NMD3_9PEZI|nr:hypothetical protein LTR37_004677 [Vermiconidia calcicola]